MTVSTTSRARHRAARRPTTALSTLGQNLAGSTARRGMLAAASSGLVITMAATTASAAPDSANVAFPQVDVVGLNAEARTALTTSPTVVVPEDAEWKLDDVAAEATPAPEPEPEPVVQAAPAVDRSTSASSRTSTRSEAPAAAAAPAPAAEAAPAPAPAAPANPSGSAIVDIAYRYLGTPYVWGGSSPAGFDCSGFTSYVYAQAGINLPRSSSAQRSAGVQVSAAQARPGDLVWWPGHVGIYLGNGQHIAARNPSTPLAAGPIYRSDAVYIRVA